MRSPSQRHRFCRSQRTKPQAAEILVAGRLSGPISADFRTEKDPRPNRFVRSSARPASIRRSFGFSYASNPLGLFFCQFQLSRHISSMLYSAFQPSFS